tara:strand:- start:7228 stop:7509 length:282 start_codon:yes stop_codon:yes gene_type:complete
MDIKKECPTICIPCVAKSIRQEYIFQVFNKLKLGSIKKIDVVNTKKGFKKVFISFKEWFSNERELSIKKKILNNEILYVEYVSGVWKCKNAKK